MELWNAACQCTRANVDTTGQDVEDPMIAAMREYRRGSPLIVDRLAALRITQAAYTMRLGEQTGLCKRTTGLELIERGKPFTYPGCRDSYVPHQ